MKGSQQFGLVATATFLVWAFLSVADTWKRTGLGRAISVAILMRKRIAASQPG